LREGKTLAEAPLVLVIEDQYLLLSDLERALTEGGFATEGVYSGEEALALFMSGGKNHVALVTDVNLQGDLNGWEVARRMREKEPSLPVIYVTAYAEDWASQGVPNSVLVPKPYAPAQLVTALSNLLNIGTTPPAT
jgi:CheY-like chemotaxis protein